MKSYRQYLTENGAWLQQLKKDGKNTAMTLECVSINKYIEYLTLIGYCEEKIRLLTSLSTRFYKAYVFPKNEKYRTKYNEQSKENHISNVEYVMNKLN